MIPREHNGWFSINALLWLIAIVFLLSIPEQSDFYLLSIGFPLAFLTYAYFIWDAPKGTKLKWAILVGAIARLIAIFFFPNLSDDIYRFIWDGRIAHHGLQPYAYLPTDIVQTLPSLANDGLLDNMNSPDYYTVYPPVSQFVFYLSSWIGLSLTGSSIIMKSVFFIAEFVTLRYLIKSLQLMKMSASLVLIYWLNPLIVIESFGNLHFEVIMITFLAVALFYWQSKAIYKSMIFLSLSVGAKLLSLMVLPYLLWQIRWRKGIKALAVFVGASLVIFSPLLFGLNYGEFLSSIDLYFRKFEFNAGLYYLLRWIGFQISGYNLIAYIGPMLGLTYLLITLRYTIKDKASNAFEYLFVVLLLYILMATTIHPWYLSIPIFCSVFVRSRIVIVWSALIWLTYINYSYPDYHENLYIVALEYTLLALYFWYERSRKSKLAVQKN